MNENSDYGFRYHLSSQFPSQIIVDITEVCNLACSHCPHPDFMLSNEYAGRHLEVELNKKLVDEVCEFGRGAIKFLRYTSNGEPLVHPHAYEMIQYAVENAPVPVALTTNGTILNTLRTERLLASGVDLIDISIDAYKDSTYATIRRKGKLAKTRSNVQQLLAMVRNGGYKTKVVVSFVEQPLNSDEIDDFKDFWFDQGVSEVVIRRLHSCSGSMPTSEVGNILISGKPRRPCLYPWERIVLNARGYLAFCPSDWSHSSEMFDFRTNSIIDVWQGSFYEKLREAHLNNNYKKHEFCGQCPDWQATRWPQEGRSYSNMMQDFFG